MRAGPTLNYAVLTKDSEKILVITGLRQGK